VSQNLRISNAHVMCASCAHLKCASPALLRSALADRSQIYPAQFANALHCAHWPVASLEPLFKASQAGGLSTHAAGPVQQALLEQLQTKVTECGKRRVAQAAIDSCPVSCIHWVQKEELAALEWVMQVYMTSRVNVGAMMCGQVRISARRLLLEIASATVPHWAKSHCNNEMDLQGCCATRLNRLGLSTLLPAPACSTALCCKCNGHERCMSNAQSINV